MRFVFRTPGANRRVMHIERHTVTGAETFQPLCDTPGPFNRTINAPWGLGRPVCKRCERIAARCSGPDGETA